MHGLQLWVALPEDARHGPPRFEHHREMPVRRLGDATVTVVIGELGGARSPAQVHTPLLGAEIVVPATAGLHLPTEPGFEYGLLAMTHAEGSSLTGGRPGGTGRVPSALSVAAGTARGRPVPRCGRWVRRGGRRHSE